jgi:DNA-binding GntR family transcriptional regulator
MDNIMMDNIMNDKYNGILKNNLSTIVVEYLKEKIFKGEYRQGERIQERAIAEDLDISRAPVREGIRELQLQGLLEFTPRKGNIVAVFSMEDLKEIFDIRLLLENDIIDILIAENLLNEKDFAHLNYLVEEMIHVANSSDATRIKIFELNKKDSAFHQYLWSKAGSRRRCKILVDLFLQLKMAMIIDTEISGDFVEVASQHFDIIRALKAGDSLKAKLYLKNHIISYKNELFDTRD